MSLSVRNYEGGVALSTRTVSGVDVQGVFTPGPLTAVVTTVSALTSTQVLKAAASNQNRRRLIIYNDSTAILFVKEGINGDSNDFSYPVAAKDTLVIEPPEPYQGVLSGAWASANGLARITEET